MCTWGWCAGCACEWESDMVRGLLCGDAIAEALEVDSEQIRRAKNGEAFLAVLKRAAMLAIVTLIPGELLDGEETLQSVVQPCGRGGVCRGGVCAEVVCV